MEAAVRHAAMLDPTAPASRWTLEKPWMWVTFQLPCAVPLPAVWRVLMQPGYSALRAMQGVFNLLWMFS